MQISDLLEKLTSKPEQVEFKEVMAAISANYHYQPCTFSNGELVNRAGTNEGSCKIFAFENQIIYLNQQLWRALGAITVMMFYLIRLGMITQISETLSSRAGKGLCLKVSPFLNYVSSSNRYCS